VQDTHAAVEIDKIELTNIGKNADEERGEVVMKKIYEELLVQASQVGISKGLGFRV